MIKTVTETNALFELNRCKPWWTRRPTMTGPTKMQLAGRITALAIVAGFLIYCAAVLVRLVW